MTQPEIHYLSAPHGTRIAWVGAEQADAPTIIFFAGHGSDMDGTKALAAHEWADAHGVGIIRFDYFGHGKSSGDMMQGNISIWRDDCLAVIDQLTANKLILIGSSLGGWMMLLAARARPDRIAGMIGIAAAPDFTDDLIWDELTNTQQEAMERDGKIALPNPYAPEDVIYPYQLILDGRKNFVLRDRQSAPYPVRLLHGTADEEVPAATAEKLAKNLEGDDVKVTLVEGASHRFSEPAQLELLRDSLAEILAKI